MINIRVCGIPCQAKVIDYIKVEPHKGSAHTCDSDWDYYGYEEFDYELYDRKGYRAKWLDNKVTPEIEKEIRIQISEAIAKGEQDDY